MTNPVFEPIWNGSMVQRVENGAWSLLPYLMPETINEDGDTERHGRYVIAYSRDGWWVLDNCEGTILAWLPSEKEAIAYRNQVIALRTTSLYLWLIGR